MSLPSILPPSPVPDSRVPDSRVPDSRGPDSRGPDSRVSPPGQTPQPQRKKNFPAPHPFRFPAQTVNGDAPNRHAELFYLQKQIQSQTPMVIVLEDGERVDGCIEWYDRNSLKIRARTKTLVYKSAIKYM